MLWKVQSAYIDLNNLISNFIIVCGIHKWYNVIDSTKSQVKECASNLFH